MGKNVIHSSHLTKLMLMSLFSLSIFSMVPATYGFGKTCKLNGPLDDQDDFSPACTFKVDFIIASGGTGSLVTARTLLDAGYSVLIIEPGVYRDDDINVYDSSRFDYVARRYSSTYGVQLKSSFEPVLGRTNDVSIARFWGGSCNHNGQMYVKPSLHYLQELESIGGSSEWSVSSVQATFKEVEKYNRNGPIDPLRGTTGPLDVRRPEDGPISGPGSLPSFLAAATAAASGLPITQDYNGANGFGPFVRFDLLQKPNKNRSSTSTAFFPPSYMYPNGTAVNNSKFRALYRSTVVRLVFVNKKVVGVEYLRDGRTNIAFAKKEVVLGGSIFSAQILQQSGIGPASLLQSLGIKVVYDNPNVGTHAHNHPAVVLDFIVNPDLLPGILPSDPYATYMGGAFFPSWNAPGRVNSSELQYPRKFQTLWLAPYFPGDKAHLYIIQTRPVSEALVQIQSKDPLQALLYRDNFYTATEDLNEFAAFLYNGMQETFLPYLQSQDPAFGPGWSLWSSVEDAKSFILQKTSANYHYVAANRMAKTSSQGVVDPRGRVFGVSGVRIADTSIIPRNVDGNTAAMAVVIGRTIGKMIIQDNQ